MALNKIIGVSDDLADVGHHEIHPGHGPEPDVGKSKEHSFTEDGGRAVVFKCVDFAHDCENGKRVTNVGLLRGLDGSKDAGVCGRGRWTAAQHLPPGRETARPPVSFK